MFSPIIFLIIYVWFYKHPLQYLQYSIHDKLPQQSLLQPLHTTYGLSFLQQKEHLILAKFSHPVYNWRVRDSACLHTYYGRLGGTGAATPWDQNKCSVYYYTEHLFFCQCYLFIFYLIIAPQFGQNLDLLFDLHNISCKPFYYIQSNTHLRLNIHPINSNVQQVFPQQLHDRTDLSSCLQQPFHESQHVYTCYFRACQQILLSRKFINFF